jgi:hypothetical protein
LGGFFGKKFVGSLCFWPNNILREFCTPSIILNLLCGFLVCHNLCKYLSDAKFMNFSIEKLSNFHKIMF